MFDNAVVAGRRQTAGGKKKKQKQKKHLPVKKSKKYMKKTKKKPMKKSKKKKQTSTSVSSILKRGNRKSKGKQKRTVGFKGKKSSRRIRAGMARDDEPYDPDASEDEWYRWVFKSVGYLMGREEPGRDYEGGNVAEWPEDWKREFIHNQLTFLNPLLSAPSSETPERWSADHKGRLAEIFTMPEDEWRSWVYNQIKSRKKEV
jgi:hypothetical protein